MYNNHSEQIVPFLVFNSLPGCILVLTLAHRVGGSKDFNSNHITSCSKSLSYLEKNTTEINMGKLTVFNIDTPTSDLIQDHVWGADRKAALHSA